MREAIRPLGFGQNLGSFEPLIGLQRAIHRRDGDGLAAKQIEQGIEEPHAFPQ